MPNYPIYIVSKGRWDSRLTVKALEAAHIDYQIAVEPHEYDQYAAVIAPERILTLPFSNLGHGSIPARNYVWEHALARGARRHWVLDDNIKCFRRYVRNQRVRLDDDEGFREIERYADAYENVGLAGMNYTFLIKQGDMTQAWDKPYRLNTRIYSCILIDNALPFHWRGRYNEDTDLSLRVLKAGYCTMLFHLYMCDKVRTLTMRGGNTTELYRTDDQFDGRLAMARSLEQQHPDVVKVTRKWGRWQHQVDYRPFQQNRLKKAMVAVG